MNKFTINSESDIKIIMKNLNSINQIMKNIRNDKTYTISKRRAIAPPNQNYDERDNNKNCGWHFADLKIELPYLSDLTFLVKGDEYYSFYKEFKNNVKEINIITNNHKSEIQFLTITDSKSGKYNLYLDIDTNECKYDISKINNYLQIISDIESQHYVTTQEYEIDDSILSFIDNIEGIPKTVIFADQYKVRMTKKLLPVLNKSSKIKYKVYELKNWSDGNDNYFIIQFITERKELNMIDAYACINY